MDTRRAPFAGALVALALVVTGCAADTDATDAAPSPAPTPSTATPTPTPTYAVPDTLDGEIARVVHTPDGGADDSPVTAGTASDVVVADEPFTLRGDCIGESVPYRVVRAAVDSDNSELTSGTLVCGQGEVMSSYSSPYEGLVQVMFGSTDRIERAWLVVLPAT